MSKIDSYRSLARAVKDSYKMGELVQLRDYQNPKDIERLYAELEKQAAQIMTEFGGTKPGIDGMTFTAPDSDPA